MALLVVILSVFYIAMVVVWVSQVFFKMDDQEVKVQHQSPPSVYDCSVDPSVLQGMFIYISSYIYKMLMLHRLFTGTYVLYCSRSS